jgi:hypothetical protein
VRARALRGAPRAIVFVASAVTIYPWKWLWPVGLSPMYGLPVTVNPFEWRFLPLAAFPALMVLPVSGPPHAGIELAATSAAEPPVPGSDREAVRP